MPTYHNQIIFFRCQIIMKRLCLAVLSLVLYIGDVGSDIWVGTDLILRCHYYHGIGVFSLVLLTGFLAGSLSLISEIAEGTWTKTDVCKALVYPFWFLPKTIWTLLQDIIRPKNSDAFFSDTRKTAKM